MPTFNVGDKVLCGGEISTIQDVKIENTSGGGIAVYYLDNKEHQYFYQHDLQPLPSENAVQSVLNTPQVKDCVYVLTTNYEHFKVLQARYLGFSLPFLYVYNLHSLLDLNPPPKYLVNEFNLSDVVLPDERLWVDGTMTYAMADRKITDIVTRLSELGTLIFSNMEGLSYYVDKEGI